MQRLKASRPTSRRRGAEGSGSDPVPHGRASDRALDRARRARQDAAGERTRAGAVLEDFERKLRAVVDATALVAGARAELADATAAVASARHRLYELGEHRGELEGLINATGSLLDRARDAQGSQRDDHAALRVRAGGLADGLEAARWARDVAASVGSECRTFGAELRGRHADAAERLHLLEESLDRALTELAAQGTAPEGAVRAALRSYDDATSGPHDPLASALADRWAELCAEQDDLNRCERRPPTEAELRAAVERARAADEALAETSARARAAVISAEDRDAIERAHGAVLDARKSWGRGGRQREQRAESELHVLLDAHGLASWLEYLTAGLSVDAEKKGVIAAAEREVVAAREELQALEAAAAPSPARVRLLEAFACAKQDATDLLGFWPGAAVEHHLRAQPLVDPNASLVLFDALRTAGVEVCELPVAPAARGWLEELESSRRARGEIEADLARVSGRIAALTSTELAPVLADAADAVSQAEEVAAAGAERWGRVEALLHATLELPNAHDADHNVVAVLESRHQALSWLLSAALGDAGETFNGASEREQRAETAAAHAERAIAQAWVALRRCSVEPLPDLPAALAKLEWLLREAAAKEDVFLAADTAFTRLDRDAAVSAP
jgi:hypothetical protein